MPGKTAEAAVEAFLAPLRQTASCLTAQPLLGSGYRPSSEPHSVAFAPFGSTVPLRFGTGLRGIDLFLNIRYRIVKNELLERGLWDVDVVGYNYDILDQSGRELVVYHWHPDAFGPSFPHLHISSRVGTLPVGAGSRRVGLGGMHFPTERVGFAAIARLLIAEFGVAPQRDDWERVLAGVSA